MDDFITKDMFLTLSGCIAVVCGIVQVFKAYIPVNPMWINLIASFLVTWLRIAVIGDYSLHGILIGVINLIPILLGASGCYEVVKNIANGIC